MAPRPLRLLGCGVDAEQPARFVRFLEGEEPWPAVFTAAELAHARSLAEPAFGLCAAFCCKEAVVKALGEPCELTGCELELDPAAELQPVRLSPALARARGVALAEARVLRPGPDECLAVVYLFGDRE